MAAITTNSRWKDRAISKSEAITDAWEVFKIYSGRFAEWVLFFCMIANIIEVLPGVHYWDWAAGTVMAIQIVTLDIAGFGLASMAAHARENGQEEAAKKAGVTSKWLIGIMITTLVLVTSSVLFPSIKPWLWYAEDALILVRVVMVVVYGHVIHTLRSLVGVARLHQQQEEMDGIRQELQQELQAAQSAMQQSFLAKQNQDAREAMILQQKLQQALQNYQDLQAKMQENEVANSTKMQLAISELQAKMQLAMQEKLQEMQEENLAKIAQISTCNASQNATSVQVAKQPAKPKSTTLQNKKFDARAFVFQALQNDENARNTDIAKLAKSSHHDLSESSICRYRKEYFASCNASQNASDQQAESEQP